MSQSIQLTDEIYTTTASEERYSGEYEPEPIDAEIWRFFFAPVGTGSYREEDQDTGGNNH